MRHLLKNKTSHEYVMEYLTFNGYDKVAKKLRKATKLKNPDPKKTTWIYNYLLKNGYEKVAKKFQRHYNEDFEVSEDIIKPNNEVVQIEDDDHIENQNNAKVRTVQESKRCAYCHVVFSSNEELIKHLKRNHRRQRFLNLQPPFQCELCPQKFISGMGLEYHMSLFHSKKRKAEETQASNSTP